MTDLGLRRNQSNDPRRKRCTMILRIVFTSVIIGLAAEVWAHVELDASEYFFPLEPVINYCQMAGDCSHDFVVICGQDSQGLTRSFKDNCDLFEYNCDEKTLFQHVQLDICINVVYSDSY